MRADRLVATLLLLQARGRVTAGEVAAELEVSERTARRDLEALSTAGIPVYSTRGRSGGWALLGGARTDLSGLTAAEARALFAVAGPAATADPQVKAALRKLVRALPEPFRGSAEAARSSVVVDAGAWGRSPGVRPPPPHLGELQHAVVDGEQVHLDYRRRDGSSGRRTVHPLGLAAKTGTWYLLAGTADGLRTFRVDRVSAVARAGLPVQRPAGFDLQRAWREVVDAVDGIRSPVRVLALADPSALPLLRWLLDRDLQVGGTRTDGWVDIVVTGSSAPVVARRLAGLGAAVQVLGPPEARRQLAALGRELVDGYADDAPATTSAFRTE